jgi:hypothetical protein
LCERPTGQKKAIPVEPRLVAADQWQSGLLVANQDLIRMGKQWRNYLFMPDDKEKEEKEVKYQYVNITFLNSVHTISSNMLTPLCSNTATFISFITV